jgi:phage shock protein C
LQQISQGAWISGVCLGLARYAGLDPMLVRVGAIVLSALTGGTGVIVYAVLMLVLPFAPLDPTLPPPNELSAMCRKDATALRDWILKDVR